MRGAAAMRAVLGLALVAALTVLDVLAPARGARLPWYAVEVLVFEQGDRAAASEEILFGERPPALPEGTVRLLPALDAGGGSATPRQRHAFRMLPEGSLALGAVAGRLERAEGYRILLHVAWHQLGFPRDEAPAVHLRTLEGLAPEPRASGGVSTESVDGIIRLWRRRFPHMDAELWYGPADALRRAPPLDPAPPPGTAGTGTAKEGGEPRLPGDAGPGLVRLAESRRLRLGEVHYLDHPRLGALVRVTRRR